ncbi:MAG: RluA family pseudouridine synthase [Anaerovibrio sp.]|uniref:RluA family pseudouridine synthase n=1 Tax=Anaerovibrio sp. TaxID=1872532 RepID=UPI0025C58907|nr:RluA family pseudouridine synthase [Anaerovibrio sp.]MBE6100143.1 RluA family pseudouridine synthase [Anaerovibrio sp.]
MKKHQNGLKKYIVAEKYADMLVEDYLKSVMKVSSRTRQRLFRSKNVFVNGSPVHTKRKLKGNDMVAIRLFSDETYGVKPQIGPVEVLYEDEAVIVLNKPANMLVHPTGQTDSFTLANYLAGYFQAKGQIVTIRPIHRLDRDTSGCVLFAKKPEYQTKLEAQLKANTIHRIYKALVVGVGIEKEFPDGCIDRNIGRVPGQPNRRRVDDRGKRAVTHFKISEVIGPNTLLELWLETGRTHQIRVHMNYAGYPVLGDKMYGTPSRLINRQALHASEIHFLHPLTGAKVEVRAPLPQDMGNCISKLKSFFI